MKKAVLAVVVLIVAIVAVSASAAVYFYGPLPSQEKRGIESTVSRVVDGDTIQLANGDVVRLIGIDAPEKDQPYYAEVMEQMKKLEGKIVRMEKDQTNKDRYGRYLRYIFLDDKFVNLELVRGGLVYVYIVSPDRKYESELVEAEISARTNGIGIWRKSEYSDCLILESFHYNARGDDNKNLQDEFFAIRNGCGERIEARGWSVRNTFNTFKIPDFSMEPGSEMKIISGAGENSGTETFLSSERPIWNNKGDTLYLKDGRGSVILSKSYRNE